jgi:hypothetical protein
VGDDYDAAAGAHRGTARLFAWWCRGLDIFAFRRALFAADHANVPRPSDYVAIWQRLYMVRTALRADAVRFLFHQRQKTVMKEEKFKN